MAATIVAGVCEDHQDYKLMEPSTTENPKKEKQLSYTPNLFQHISTFSSHLSHPYSRPIRVANVQEFFSLKMFYDLSWCFTSMSYHRHAENVLSKVVIACGQFVLYLWRDGASQRCQWMPLCSVSLSPHVSSLAKSHHSV